MTIVHKHTNINSGGAEPCPRTNDGAGRTAPTRTPAHTLDALEHAIAGASQTGPARQKFVNVDARVLEWLIADSRALAAGKNGGAL